MAGRIGHGARPGQIFHHHPEHAGQRLVVVAEQHAGALQRLALPAGDRLRQCAGATPAGHGEIRHQKASARHRLVDGRAADVPLGRALSRHGRAHRAVLRLGQMLAPQFRVSRRREGGASPPTPPSWMAGTKEKPAKGLRARRASMPAGDFRRPSIASGSTSSAWAIPRSRISWSPSGKASSCQGCQHLLTMLWTWQNGDITNNLNGDSRRTLAIKAKAM